MKKNTSLIDLETFQIPAFGYELIRETLLPDLLGKEHAAILYWAGKGLARKTALNDITELQNFFLKAGFGMLTLIKETKDTLSFSLTSDLIKYRLAKKEPCTFQLEAGFLAAQIEQQKQRLTEATEKQLKKEGEVILTVKSDLFDVVSD